MRFVLLSLTFAISPLATAGAQRVPPYVAAAEQSAPPRPSPAADPKGWLLAIIDVETTGLVPGWHEMIDLGVVMTDLDGRVVDSLFLRIMPRHPERLSEGARRVNGFDVAKWRRMRALTPERAADSLAAFHRRVAGSRPTLMVAFNSQFDAAFLDHLFRARGSSWRTLYHYFVLDIPSMAWARGMRDLTNGALAARLGVADEPRVADEHTGITGAMLNVRIYQALRARGMTAIVDSLAAIASSTPHAPSWQLGPFSKPMEVNPVIAPRSTSTFRSPVGESIARWEEYATFNPAAVVRDGKVHLLYRAEDASGSEIIGGHTSRLGLAVSDDGLRFTRRPAPVLYPDNDSQKANEWPGGVEDPRIVESEDGRYVLTYTQWNRQVPKLAVATSRDLLQWTKHGPAFARAGGGKYLSRETKSGAIVARVVGDRLVATKVNGKYWMYWGVPDVGIATSDDLITWTPLEDTEGRPLKVLAPRAGYFDSWLVEAGPPAIVTEHGIVVLYNAGNSGTHGDRRLPERVYTGGQALFDATNPLKLLARTDEPFIRPTEPYERTGQYKEGTTFVEGLVRFKGRWLLYYGTADSRVGVAVAEDSR